MKLIKFVFGGLLAVVMVSPVSAQSFWIHERGTLSHQLETRWHAATCQGNPVRARFAFQCSKSGVNASLVVTECPSLSRQVKNTLVKPNTEILESVSVWVQLGALRQSGWTLNGEVFGMYSPNQYDEVYLFINFDPQVLYRSLVDARSAGIAGNIEDSSSGLIPVSPVFVPEIGVADLRPAFSKFERDCNNSFN